MTTTTETHERGVVVILKTSAMGCSEVTREVRHVLPAPVNTYPLVPFLSAAEFSVYGKLAKPHLAPPKNKPWYGKFDKKRRFDV
jgi:hypothetical protein